MQRAPPACMEIQPSGGVEQLIREVHVPIDGIETADLTGFLERVGDARVVLLGTATQGTSEFYRWRARLTRELVMHKLGVDSGRFLGALLLGNR